MNESPANRTLPPATAALETRVAQLEENLLRLNAYNQEVTRALTHALKQIKRTDEQLAMRTLARASKIFPKSRSVVFVSKGYFGDNIKYAYLAFCRAAQGKNVSVHYVTDDRHQYDLLKSVGLPCLPCEPDEWSLEDIRVLFGAKVAVIKDNFHSYFMRSPKAYGMLQGAKFVQLWHGIPVKDVGMRYLVRTDGVLLDELIASAGRFDVLVAPGAAARDQWAEMLAFRDFAPLGYPRNDIFFREPDAHDLLNIDIETCALFETARQAGRTTILYTPTFRDDAASGWFGKAGIGALADHARARGYVFAVNLHPFEQYAVEEFRRHYPGIRFVAPGTDIYPVVKHAGMLITDYSSLAFDYLLLDRPLVFYRPDHDYYMKHSRGFIEGRVNMTPGAVAADPAGLVRAVDAAAGFAHTPALDPFRAARRQLRNELFDHIDGKAGERVSELILRMVDEA